MELDDMKELKKLIDENNPTIEIIKERVEDADNPSSNVPDFKMPTVLGRPGRAPRDNVLSAPVVNDETVDNNANTRRIITVPNRNNSPSILQKTECSYVPPPWSGLPQTTSPYNLEVLKSGVSLEYIDLMKRPFWIFGRLPTCDVPMAHPTISRNHAVIQYKTESSEDMPVGFYLYDLGSTHGTFLNKLRIKPKMYVRVQVGHMIKLGCSTRSYLLNGPDDDAEEESELSVTELKQLRAEQIRQQEAKERERIEQEEKEKEKREKEEQERGIDWGMGEDADEETDLTVNPYAETNNEDLYIDDPKKALRHFFEREGLELQYDCTERGMGQFLCTVELPIDDARGRPLVAEVLHKGKKKEAVIQCALEACRILDRHGLLRQSAQESKKRKAKNWEENDYYDSDEDTFLDRTGTIEKKREKRMKANQPQLPETYQSLCEKEKSITEKMKQIEKELDNINKSKLNKKTDEDDADSLDTYMKELNDFKPDKYKVGRLKNELTQLRKEHAEVVKLVNLTRPADLPPLVIENTKTLQPGTSGVTKTSKGLPMFGKRTKIEVKKPTRQIPSTITSNSDEEEDSDTDDKNEEIKDKSDTDEVMKSDKNFEIDDEQPSTSYSRKRQQNDKSDADSKKLKNIDGKLQTKISKTVSDLQKIAEEEESIVVDEKRLAMQKHKILEQVNSGPIEEAESRRFNLRLKQLNRLTSEFCSIGDRKMRMVNKINKLAKNINSIAGEIRVIGKEQHEIAVSRMQEFVEKIYQQQYEIYLEMEKIQKNTRDKEILDKLEALHDELIEHKTSLSINLIRIQNCKDSENLNIIDEITQFEEKSEKTISKILGEIKILNEKIENEEKPAMYPEESDEEDKKSEDDDDDDDKHDDKKKKKNLRRIHQRLGKAEIEKQKQYEEDAKKEDYNMWMPPDNQTGDGRTKLNEKYGY